MWRLVWQIWRCVNALLAIFTGLAFYFGELEQAKNLGLVLLVFTAVTTLQLAFWKLPK